MKLNIGEKIKCLRHEKNITQEEFAEILGISCQSVSRWENNICYPDIELLPIIAKFFGITIDCLIDVDETIEKENLAKYLNQFQEAISEGKIYDCITIARNGVAEYPNNYLLLNKLMYALFLAGDNDGNIPEWQKNSQKYDQEITMLGERIMKYCPDINIRLEAAGRLAFNHCEMGRKEIGRAIYETLPSQKYCKETQIWWGLNEDEKLSFIYNRIKESYEGICHGIYLLLHEKLLSDRELIQVCQKMFDLDNLIFDEKPPIEWRTANIHYIMAIMYARLKQYDQMYNQLKIAVKNTKDFDMRPDYICVSSLLLGKFKKQKTDFETTDSRTLCEIMQYKWLEVDDFNSIRDTAEFKEIIQLLLDSNKCSYIKK